MSEGVPRTESLSDPLSSAAGRDRGTNRMVPGTDRLAMAAQKGDSTDRVVTDAAAGTAGSFRQETLIADRYRIDAGLLSGGSAELYRCTDIETNEEVAVKLYRGRGPAHREAGERLRGLQHPNIVAMHATGVWSGWIYEAMEYCTGGSLADHLPLNEDALRSLLPGLVAALEFLQGYGIVHRDVKPSNILFRGSERQEPVLADFDISSLLDPHHTGIRSTETGANLTIDYAAPELCERNEVGPKTDYYALGVTIAHVLIGRSPFHGWGPNQVLIAHMRGDIPVADLCDASRSLIRGLTDYSPDNRWGAAQVRAWLAGKTVRDDVGREWQPSKAGPTMPFPGLQEASTPRELAAHLEEFDAEGALYRTDDIGRWVHDNHGADLAGRIRALSEEFASDQHQRKLGLFKLRFLLDPALPLKVGRHEVFSLMQLNQVIENGDPETLERLMKLVSGRQLECWIDAVRPVEESELFVTKVAGLRERLGDGDHELATFALLHTFDPDRPLELVSGVAAGSPSEIAPTLKQAGEGGQAALEAMLFSGKLEEWLRAAEFTDWEVDVDFLTDCRTRYGRERDIACFGALCRFHPQEPLPFGGQSAANPQELARLIDRDRRSRALGIDLLRRGWIRTWLVGARHLADPARFDRWVTASRNGISWESKLEAVLQLLDPKLPRPEAVAVPAKLDFGRIPLDAERRATLKIDSATRGHLAGEAHVAEGSRGVSVSARFEGTGSTLRVTVNTKDIPIGSRQATEVRVTSSGGTLQVPVTYRVLAPLGRMLGRSLLAGGIAGAVLGFLRILVARGLEESGYRVPYVVHFSDIFHALKSWVADGIGVYLLGLVLLGLVAGYGYYLWKATKRSG